MKYACSPNCFTNGSVIVRVFGPCRTLRHVVIRCYCHRPAGLLTSTCSIGTRVFRTPRPIDHAFKSCVSLRVHQMWCGSPFFGTWRCFKGITCRCFGTTRWCRNVSYQSPSDPASRPTRTKNLTAPLRDHKISTDVVYVSRCLETDVLLIFFLLNFIIVGGQNPVVLREDFLVVSINKSAECLLWYDTFVNCDWVDTRWQYYSTHLHTNSTQNTVDTKIHITIKFTT